jgi:lipoprotein-releasing system permease protein
MDWFLSKFFFKFVFNAKTRQNLLFFAAIGLALSCFSLLVIQSTMGGLQEKLVSRSKAVNGEFSLILVDEDTSWVPGVLEYFEFKKIPFSKEYQIEALLRSGKMLFPLELRGIDIKDHLPENLNFYFPEPDSIILGEDLAYRARPSSDEQLQVISPGHVDTFMGEIPRSRFFKFQESHQTMVSEVDTVVGWSDIKSVQSLTRVQTINRIRVYSPLTNDLKEKLLEKFPELKSVIFRTWDDENSSLSWALRLENTVMLFLFGMMTILVSLSITSGLLIFYGKIKRDLVSLWILGASKKRIDQSMILFVIKMSFFSCLIGIFLGAFFLWGLKAFSPQVMPDIFVDRSIPVLFSFKAFVLAFFIPFGISMIFLRYSLRDLKQGADFISYLKSFNN